MNKKSYQKPSMRVVELKNRAALLSGSLTRQKSIRGTSNSEGIGYEENGIGGSGNDM